MLQVCPLASLGRGDALRVDTGPPIILAAAEPNLTLGR
jgi:hypothetical protein